MKLALITALMIALWPYYAIADTRPENGTPDNPGRRPAGGTNLDQRPARPTGTGTPDGHRTPGGTRDQLGACAQTAQHLTALVPGNGNGLTTAEHPVFWFYIPYAPENLDSIEFSLLNQDETITLYTTSLQLSQTSGVISIPLPPIPKASLKPNESYHWYFKANCEPKEISEDTDITLDGWVKRVEPSSNLENQSGVIWYDQLTNLAQRYFSDPQNIEAKQAWTELLRSVGLEGLAEEQLVNTVSHAAK